ncbi:MAG TPA: hypothetical protein VFH48_06870 [Chloroflexota bacterium]|nr:hypothetical protein [Chloroflexota bacterium]
MLCETVWRYQPACSGSAYLIEAGAGTSRCGPAVSSISSCAGWVCADVRHRVDGDLEAVGAGPGPEHRQRAIGEQGAALVPEAV